MLADKLNSVLDAFKTKYPALIATQNGGDGTVLGVVDDSVELAEDGGSSGDDAEE